jgi:hypothetical protein
MDEISNKTLATLLVVAIVISLAGTFFAMRGVSQVTNIISGAQVQQSGTAQVNITSQTSISLTADTVNFGSGYRNETNLTSINNECNMSSNDAAAPDCWIVSDSFSPADFVLENDGNRYVAVTINSTAAANYFDTCSLATGIDGGEADFAFTGEEGAEAGCTTDGTLTDSETPFDATDQTLCTNMSYIDANDEFNISISIDVPAGPAGECSSTVDFEATAVTS